MTLCKCGCGQEVKSGREYIYHHHRRGASPWNKGLTKETDAMVEAISAKVSVTLTGRTRSPETIAKQRASIMGKNKGRVFGDTFREMRRQVMLGTIQSPKSNEKRSQTMRAKIRSGEWFPINSFSRPNKAEAKLLQILGSPWRFVGDGQLIIGGKCPDFWNGDHQLIELFGDYWHSKDDQTERIDHFARYDYNCLVIWGHELQNTEQIKAILVEEFGA